MDMSGYDQQDIMYLVLSCSAGLVTIFPERYGSRREKPGRAENGGERNDTRRREEFD
jgi:hypothetical protein